VYVPATRVEETESIYAMNLAATYELTVPDVSGARPNRVAVSVVVA
jgi:hypothetical protein